ncbi:MAG: response regulator, partial [Fischerella sp.]|nr:response regulator [Fischerella sp.]
MNLDRPCKILIINHDSRERETYRDYLLQSPNDRYTLMEAESGEEGLILCGQHQPDLMILNFLLPDLDGLEFLTQLNAQLDQIPPVILVTEQEHEAVALQAIQDGVQDYLIKGQITRERLQFTVVRAIANTQQMQELRRSEARFRATVENLLDCFGVYTAVRNESGEIIDFRVEYVNAAACVANRMTKQEQIGRRLCDLLPAHQETRLFEEYCQVVETGIPLVKESFPYSDIYNGERLTRFFDIHISKLEDGFVAAWRDVTD